MVYKPHFGNINFSVWVVWAAQGKNFVGSTLKRRLKWKWEFFFWKLNEYFLIGYHSNFNPECKRDLRSYLVFIEPNLCVTGLIFAGNTKCATRQNKTEPVRKTGFAGWMLLLLHYSIHCRMTVKKIATATKRWPWNTVRTHIVGVSECQKYWWGQSMWWT